jgi:hypothetical protein
LPFAAFGGLGTDWSLVTDHRFIRRRTRARSLERSIIKDLVLCSGVAYRAAEFALPGPTISV